MLIGSFADVDDIVKTCPWGLEHTITFHEHTLDGKHGWSVFVMVDPGGARTLKVLCTPTMQASSTRQ